MLLERPGKASAADELLSGKLQEGLELHRSASWKQGHHSAEGWRITGKAPSKDGPGAVVLDLSWTAMLIRISSQDCVSHPPCLLMDKCLGSGAFIHGQPPIGQFL